MIAKILIVDDNPFILRLLHDFLVGQHHQVLEATDGAQAFSIAEKEKPHLIIMDIVMPGLYGSTAAKKLQDLAATTAIPILILSAYSEEMVRSLTEANRKIRFVRKPIDFKILQQIILELLPEGGYAP